MITFRAREKNAASVWLPLFLIGISFTAGCRPPAVDAPDEVVTVKLGHPKVGTIAEQIDADAILAPLSQAALSPRISAPIRAEYVQRGSHVHRGQLLLTLEDRDLRGAALDSKGGLVSAEAVYATTTAATIPEDVQRARLDVAQTKANLDVAARTSRERQQLFEQGALPGRDADIAAAATVQAQAAYDTAVQHLESVLQTTRSASAKSAEGQLTSAQGRLMNAAAQVDYASLRSPIDGVVTERPLFPGETALAGTTVLTVMDTSSLLAKLHIAQALAQQLTTGGPAEITIAGVDKPIYVSIVFIGPVLDAGSATVEVWLKLLNTDGRYKVGSAVHAVIHGATVSNALLLPAAALLPMQDGGTNVMVVGSDARAHLRAVKVGIRTAGTVQITSGLGSEETVALEGSYGLDDGTRVRGTEPENGH